MSLFTTQLHTVKCDICQVSHSIEGCDTEPFSKPGWVEIVDDGAVKHACDFGCAQRYVETYAGKSEQISRMKLVIERKSARRGRG